MRKAKPWRFVINGESIQFWEMDRYIGSASLERIYHAVKMSKQNIQNK